jgi:hypothetical protein
MWANLFGKLTIARSRTNWEDNMKLDLTERKCEDGRLTKLAKDQIQWCILVYLGISWY